MTDQVLAKKLTPIQESGKAIEDKLKEMKKQRDTTNVIYKENAPISL